MVVEVVVAVVAVAADVVVVVAVAADVVVVADAVVRVNMSDQSFSSIFQRGPSRRSRSGRTETCVGVPLSRASLVLASISWLPKTDLHSRSQLWTIVYRRVD